MRTNGGHGSSVPCEEEENKGRAAHKRERKKVGKRAGEEGRRARPDSVVVVEVASGGDGQLARALVGHRERGEGDREQGLWLVWW